MYKVTLSQQQAAELSNRIKHSQLSERDQEQLIELVTTYRHPHPAVTVDMVIFTVMEQQLKTLLIKRGNQPFIHKWALPGGFLHVAAEESLQQAAARELEEETGVRDVFLQQLSTFGDPQRDPRERVISVAYYAIIPADVLKLKAGSDAEDTQWFNFNELAPLAFDHAEIIQLAYQAIVANIKDPRLSLQFVADEFTLFELQKVQEIILNNPIDKRNFQNELKKQGYIGEQGSANACMAPTGRKKASNRGRAAELYRKHSLSHQLRKTATMPMPAPQNKTPEADSAYELGFKDGVKSMQDKLQSLLPTLK